MATADQTIPVKSGPSIVIQIAILLVMTAAAIGIGWFSGSYLNGTVVRDPVAAAEAAPAKPAKVDGHGTEAGGHGEAKDEHGDAKAAGNPLLLDLPPIMTNIAAPSDIWLRVELSVIFDEPPTDPGMADAIHQDLLAFVRTVKMHQIEGASGFQHLKADLGERASIRSGGHAKEILIRTLLFE
jgi:flagellar FliL protein